MDRTKYYLPDEVVIHNTIQDCWVVVHGQVIDLTTLFADRTDSMTNLLQLLAQFGGKDLTADFCANGQPKMMLTAAGNWIPRCLPAFERAHCRQNYTKGHFWWNDPKYVRGRITRCVRHLRIINTLTKTTTGMDVCDEDTIGDIQRKYRHAYNNHAGSYTWRKTMRNCTSSGRLDVARTLTQNGIVSTPGDDILPPALWLFYNDDFTVG